MFKKLLLVMVCAVSFVNAQEDLKQDDTGKDAQEQLSKFDVLKNNVKACATKYATKENILLSSAIGAKCFCSEFYKNEKGNFVAYSFLFLESIIMKYYKSSLIKSLSLNLLAAEIVTVGNKPKDKTIHEKFKEGLTNGLVVCVAAQVGRLFVFPFFKVLENKYIKK